MAFAAGFVVTILLMQPSLEVGVILTFVLSIAQAAILFCTHTSDHGSCRGLNALHPSSSVSSGRASLPRLYDGRENGSGRLPTAFSQIP
jgi:hypothetical protein